MLKFLTVKLFKHVPVKEKKYVSTKLWKQKIPPFLNLYYQIFFLFTDICVCNIIIFEELEVLQIQEL